MIVIQSEAKDLDNIHSDNLKLFNISISLGVQSFHLDNPNIKNV